MLVGLRIWGDGWGYDNCKYKFVKSDLSFKYFDISKDISVFDRETDNSRSNFCILKVSLACNMLK